MARCTSLYSILYSSVSMKANYLIRVLQPFVQGLFRTHSIASPLAAERAEQAFYIQYLQEGMVVFDVGAHIGELTLLFSRFVGQRGQVHAFEACGATFERLKTLCQLANRRNVILNDIALADSVGPVKLHVYDSEHSGWNSLAERPLRSYGIHVDAVGIEEVPAVTVDAYCEQKDIAHIDLLKIDVEGAEYQVLKGARGMLGGKKIRCCVFEFGSTTFDMKNDPDAIETYLMEFGYVVKNVVKGNPVFPGRESAEKAQFSLHVAIPKK